MARPDTVVTTVSTKGQVILPKAVRRCRDWDAGTRLIVQETPADIARALRTFGGLTEVAVENATVVAAAFDLAESGMDIADALHLGLSHMQGAVLTFDRKFAKSAQSVGIALVREAWRWTPARTLH